MPLISPDIQGKPLAEAKGEVAYAYGQIDMLKP